MHPFHVGMGLRRALFDHYQTWLPRLDFLELAPENWCELGNSWRSELEALREDVPFVAHGLSLSLGGSDPFNPEYLAAIRRFLDEFEIEVYSEHLCFTGHGGSLYELLPLPFNREAVEHVVRRIDQVQEAVQRPLVVEHVSYYYEAPGATMSEIDFILAVQRASGCRLLLDVNNLYVNSVNHGSDPRDLYSALRKEDVAYLHMAGHHEEEGEADSEPLLVDTHGADICGSVWELLDDVYAHFGPIPTLLERDSNFPDPPELMLDEVDEIRKRLRATTTVEA